MTFRKATYNIYTDLEDVDELEVYVEIPASLLDNAANIIG